MKIKTMWVSVLIAVALVLMAGGAGALPGATAPAATVASQINYQGRLTDPGGAPLSGVFPMQFRIYDDPEAGMLLWDSGVMNVSVDHGLFNVGLSVDPVLFNGRALWLWINVNGEWLWPRQELLPVPYALSLRPGAIVQGEPTEWEGHVVRVNMEGAYPLGKAVWGTVSTGQAVRGDATGGYGLYGYSDTGNALVANSNAKTAGVFDSNEGYGIRVNTNGTDHWDHAGYFTANWGYGVYGVSTNNYGVRGEGTVAGVRGIGVSSGVSGSSEGGNGVSGWSNSYSGVYGSSDVDFGVEGNTWRADNNYGLFSYDNLYSLNFHSAGAIMQVAQNGGDEPLEPGDVVVFAGVVEPEEPGGPLIVQVAKASQANSPAVAGVVYSRFNIEAVLEGNRPEAGSLHEPQETTIDGPVPAGEHLLLVVQGPVRVKASALEGAIQPGDLLCSAAEAGYATRVDTAAPGTVFGKALESLEADRGQIYVFVTLH